MLTHCWVVKPWAKANQNIVTNTRCMLTTEQVLRKNPKMVNLNSRLAWGPGLSLSERLRLQVSGFGLASRALPVRTAPARLWQPGVTRSAGTVTDTPSGLCRACGRAVTVQFGVAIMNGHGTLEKRAQCAIVRKTVRHIYVLLRMYWIYRQLNNVLCLKSYDWQDCVSLNRSWQSNKLELRHFSCVWVGRNRTHAFRVRLTGPGFCLSRLS